MESVLITRRALLAPHRLCSRRERRSSAFAPRGRYGSIFLFFRCQFASSCLEPGLDTNNAHRKMRV